MLVMSKKTVRNARRTAADISVGTMKKKKRVVVEHSGVKSGLRAQCVLSPLYNPGTPF
jgi:hypothetical protein